MSPFLDEHRSEGVGELHAGEHGGSVFEGSQGIPGLRTHWIAGGGDRGLWGRVFAIQHRNDRIGLRSVLRLQFPHAV